MSQSQFNKAVAIVGALPPTGEVKPSDDDKLIFYANFKQASVGDVNVAKPGMFDFVGKAKWEAWNKVKGTSKEDAQKTYVEKLKAVSPRCPFSSSKKEGDGEEKIEVVRESPLGDDAFSSRVCDLCSSSILSLCCNFA
ncbi:acyl CoA binding protein-domain-containing protein [Mrakia frigida]|uniref:acyl-CoA-binding protein n=1 Tax=Mrakia frigida TaxID=29902 RepID=UPI003FCBF2B4